ncbi:hypothetical protein [Stenotrophomonas sp.]|uniref:hypothetical protein n=1 Tax=Stenotrophomonas sp. TaxID=69392 RepID=UPI0028AF5C1F|nr:hypothetical protein [Stenotrophomonas sp.]
MKFLSCLAARSVDSRRCADRSSSGAIQGREQGMGGYLLLKDDFEARIRLLAHEEGGRRHPAYNGIRWDFAYADASGEFELFMIFPEFLGEDSQPLAEDIALPVGPWLRARMRIVNRELRQTLHRDRIVEGVRFHCHEGPHVCAVGEVTRITGLHETL